MEIELFLETLILTFLIVYICLIIPNDKTMIKIKYKSGNTVAHSILLWNGSPQDKPLMLLLPNQFGLTKINIKNALEIASDKYIVFLTDMYGLGKYTTNEKESKTWATEFKENPLEGRKRSNDALQTFIKEAKKRCIGDIDKISVVGFCFGGGNALELARSGADVSVIICLHGDLISKYPTNFKLKQNILVLHDSLDSTTPLEDRIIFEKEMNDTKTNWQMNIYGGIYTENTYNRSVNIKVFIFINVFIENSFN